jgi:hypothetical protein
LAADDRSCRCQVVTPRRFVAVARVGRAIARLGATGGPHLVPYGVRRVRFVRVVRLRAFLGARYDVVCAPCARLGRNRTLEAVGSIPISSTSTTLNYSPFFFALRLRTRLRTIGGPIVRNSRGDRR